MLKTELEHQHELDLTLEPDSLCHSRQVACAPTVESHSLILPSRLSCSHNFQVLLALHPGPANFFSRIGPPFQPPWLRHIAILFRCLARPLVPDS